MPSTVYKGDLAEVTLGHETGIVLTKGAFNGLAWSATTGAGGANNDSTDTTRIAFSGATMGFFDDNGRLKYPVGLLAGCTLRIKSSGTNYGAYDYNKGNVYTIVSNGVGADGVIDAASLKEIVITPALGTASTVSGLAGEAGDEIYIDALGTPTWDPNHNSEASANASDERILADQFIGLAAEITLPETTVEVLRSHVVGIGRQVVVQEPQHIKNEGGSLSTMMHSARWLYYALGNEAIKVPTTVEGTVNQTASSISMGDSYVGFANAATLSAVSVGDYIVVVDDDATRTPYAKEPATLVEFPTNMTQFHTSEKNEMRRVIAVDNVTSGMKRLYIDDPFNFDHAAGCTVKYVCYDDAALTGSPNFDIADATYGSITNRQTRAMWSMWHQPSFCLEASIRTRDVGSYITDELNSEVSSGSPGSANDSKQLTRVYKGCKVKSWELTADADSEVKMKVDFDALMCYTDTGRLENSGAGDRYTAHRMFENIGNGPKERKEAGIAPNTEKPFFFYNGTIVAFGSAVAQVTNFNLTGNNNVTTHLVVGANPLREPRNTNGESLEQIPFGGSRNPSLSVEGKVEYELAMTIIPTDPLLWHEFRTTRQKGYSEPITLHLVKNGAGPTREEVLVIIDDYIIQEAPLQIQEDKGVIKQELKILPRHVKVVAHDALLHC